MEALLKLIPVTGIQRSEPKHQMLGSSADCTGDCGGSGPDDDDCNPNDCDDD